MLGSVLYGHGSNSLGLLAENRYRGLTGRDFAVREGCDSV